MKCKKCGAEYRTIQCRSCHGPRWVPVCPVCDKEQIKIWEAHSKLKDGRI